MAQLSLILSIYAYMAIATVCALSDVIKTDDFVWRITVVVNVSPSSIIVGGLVDLGEDQCYDPYYLLLKTKE